MHLPAKPCSPGPAKGVRGRVGSGQAGHLGEADTLCALVAPAHPHVIPVTLCSCRSQDTSGPLSCPPSLPFPSHDPFEVWSGGLAKRDTSLVRGRAGPWGLGSLFQALHVGSQNKSYEAEKRKSFRFSSSALVHFMSTSKNTHSTEIKACVSQKIVFIKENQRKCETYFIGDVSRG